MEPNALAIKAERVPKLRFTDINDQWYKTALYAILSESRKRNIDHKYDKNDVLSVSGEFGVVNQIKFQGRSFAGVSVANYHVVESGEIVYTKSPLKANPYGVIKYNQGNAGIVSTLYAVYKTVGANSPQFLDYYFQLDDNVNKYLRPLVHKGAKNDMKISNSHVLDGSIFLPSSKEQDRIVGFLVLVDERIQAAERKQMLLQRYRKGLARALFAKKKRFKGADSSQFPDWRDKQLGEIGKTYNGLTNKGADDFGRGKPFITYKQVFDNPTIDTSKFALVEVTADERQNTVEKGDILFTTSSENPEEVGYSSLLAEDIRELYLNSFCFGYRINEQSVLLPKFAQFLFRSELFRKKVVPLAQGSTRYNLSKSALMRLIVSLPDLEEQQKIAYFLTAIDKRISLSKKELEQAKNFKKALLQQMFI